MSSRLVKHTSPASHTTSPGRQSDGFQRSQGSTFTKGGKKRKASPIREPSGKIIKGPQKSLGLPQVVDPDASVTEPLVVRNESPWDTFKELFSCDLAGTASIVAYRTRPSRLRAIRAFGKENADQMLEKIREIRHENIIFARECYKDENSVYAVFDDLPLTLEHVVACDAYPSEAQLASILVQILDGLSHLLVCGFEHRSLSCSNILLGLDGIVQIAALEHCVKRLPAQSQAESIDTLATVTMQLMQNYDKDDGLRGIDDIDRWSVDSQAFKFLEATTRAVSIDQLKQHTLVTGQRRSKDVLVGLARFALISARTFYSYKP